MNPANVTKILTDFFRWMQTPAGRTTIRAVSMTAKALPPIVQKIDSWISSASYAEAVRKVKEIESADARLVKQTYLMYYNKMSPEVRLAYQESLKRRGENF